VLGSSRLVASAFLAAGPALAVGFSSGRFEARGSSVHGLRGGATGPGQPLGGAAAFVDAAGTIQVETGSNLEILGAVAPSVQLVPSRPYVQWTGTVGPGSNRSLECFGPAGNIAVAFAALGSLYDTTAIQGFEQPLSLDLNTLIWTASGSPMVQNLPLAFPVTLPPSPAFAGRALPTQAAVVSNADFSVELSNGDDLLLSYSNWGPAKRPGHGPGRPTGPQPAGGPPALTGRPAPAIDRRRQPETPFRAGAGQ
jgi:hypothetical protein